ncbi:MAG: M23 family metallopeptidase [archaeon]
MEREEIFGAIIVLVIILVIALIIYNTQGDAGKDIRQIADEVFGWTKQEQLAEAKKAGEVEANKFIDRLVTIHEHSLSNTNKDCTYSLKGYELTEKYNLDMTYFTSGNTLIKFNIIDSQDDRLIATKTLDKKQSEWKIEPCYMEDATKRVQGGSSIKITQTKDKVITVGNKKFYDDVPQLYKYDQSHVCFITQIETTSIGVESSATKYRNYFLGLKDCESGTVSGEDQAKAFFNNFVESVKRCRSLLQPAKNCKCNSIKFDEMLDRVAIVGTVQENDVLFELYYDNKKIDQETINDTKAGNIEAGFFDTKGTYKPWQPEQTFNKASNELFLVITRGKELAFATPRAAEARGAFLRWAWAETIESCAPDFNIGVTDCKPGTNIIDYACIIANDEFRQTNMATKENIQKYFETKDSVLKGEYNGKKYSDYIYETSQKYGINPVVMLATMQKEQSLISVKSTDTNSKSKLDRAFGCGISDNKNKDVSQYLGFDKQVDCAGSTLKKWYDEGLQVTPTKMKVNYGKLNQVIYNAATYSLYKYTPHTSVNGAGGNLLFFDVYKRIKSEIGIETRQPAQIASSCNIQVDKFGSLPLKTTDLDKTKGGGKGYDPFNYPGCPGYNPSYYPNRCQSIHRGMDIYATKNGVPVLSIADGELFAVKDCTYVLHTIEGQQYTSAYCHVKGDTSLIGKTVKKGQQIGTVNYNPPHIHLEIYKGKVTSAAPTSKYESTTACIAWNQDPNLLNPTQIVSA